MKVAFAYGLYVIYQLVLVLYLNHAYSLEIVGTYFVLLAFLTPVTNLFQLGGKNYAASCSEENLVEFFKAKLFVFFIFMIASLLLSFMPMFLFYDNKLLAVAGYLLAVKGFEQISEIVIPFSERKGNNLHIYSLVCINLILIIVASVSKANSGFLSEYFFLLLSLAVLALGIGACYFVSQPLIGKWSLIYLLDRRAFSKVLLKLLPLGLGLVVMGLTASIPRYAVFLTGGEEAAGAFGNILYSYVVGLLIVNAAAIKTAKDRTLETKALATLALVFAIGGGVVLVWGDEIILLVYGQSMVNYAEYFLYLYFPIVLSLFGSFFDYRLVRDCSHKVFMISMMLVLLMTLISSIALTYSSEKPIMVGFGILFTSSITKLLIQSFYLKKRRSVGV